MASEHGIGILAYGSLITDPGAAISEVLLRRIPTMTPFPVEYGRLSRTRGGAPTVVPHPSGKPVKAEVLVLRESVSIDEAKNLLWRRETRSEGSKKTYSESNSPNALLVRDIPGFCDLAHVLYADFNQSGKIEQPDPDELAKAAIQSVHKAKPGKDGISYLMDLVDRGIETAHTREYGSRILARTGASSLEAALKSLTNVELG